MSKRVERWRVWSVASCVALVAALGLAPDARAAEGDAKLAADVLAVFDAKCASCHSPKAKKSKKFSTVLDLAVLRADPKLIVPGKPEESAIWKSITTTDEDDVMPPVDSEVEPLTAAEKDAVTNWIKAGAPGGGPPAVASTQGGATTAPTTVPMAPAALEAPVKREPRPFVKRLIVWLGKFHPLAAHTPIAVLMAAAISEMLYMRYRAPGLTAATRFCTVLGAFGAIGTAALGWAMAVSKMDSELLDSHRWQGTAAAAISIPIAILVEWGSRRAAHHKREWHGASRWVFRLAIFGLAGFVGYAAHLGGALHWGEDHFQFPKY